MAYLDPALSGRLPDDLDSLRLRRGEHGELVVYLPAPAASPAVEARTRARRGRRPDPPALVVESEAYRRLTPSERAVLRLAFDRWRQDGGAVPLAVRWVAEKSELSVSTAASAIKRLVDSGFIREAAKGKSGPAGVATTYRLTFVTERGWPATDEFLTTKQLDRAERLKRARKVAGRPLFAKNGLRLEGFPITSNTCEGETRVDTAMHAKNSPKNGDGDR